MAEVKLLERVLARCQNEREEEESERPLHLERMKDFFGVAKKRFGRVPGRNIEGTRFVSLDGVVCKPLPWSEEKSCSGNKSCLQM